MNSLPAQKWHLRFNVGDLLGQGLVEGGDIPFLGIELVNDPLKDALEAGVVDRDREHLFKVERARDLNLLLRHTFTSLKTNYFK